MYVGGLTGGALGYAASEFIGGVAEGLNGETASFFDNTRYTNKVLSDMEGGPGEFHSFPEIVRNHESSGTISEITGADGIVRQQLQIPGGYGHYEGNFTFIKELNGDINHRFFEPF